MERAPSLEERRRKRNPGPAFPNRQFSPDFAALHPGYANAKSPADRTAGLCYSDRSGKAAYIIDGDFIMPIFWAFM